MSSGVYVIRNIINGKRYIGSSSNIEARKTHHFSRLKYGRHSNSHLQKAYNKYGRDAFEFKVLELVSNDLLLDVEQKYLNERPEYNIVHIAGPMFRLGTKATPEHKTKMSEAAKRQVQRKGWHHSEDTKKIMREKALKRPPPIMTEKSKKKCSETLKARWKNLTDEEKQKHARRSSESQGGRTYRTGTCIICNNVFQYITIGKKSIKTCSSGCLSEFRTRLMTARNNKNPEMSKDASNKRWSTRRCTPTDFQHIPHVESHHYDSQDRRAGITNPPSE
jgi:group I intron endonuclease